MSYYFTVLSKYAVFMGRARRSEFWYFILFHLLILIILSIVGEFLKLDIIPAIYYWATVIPYLAVSIRRMHDVGKSGWYILIPIYNIILSFTTGDIGENEYGEDPKNRVTYGADDYEKPLDTTPDL